MKSMILQGEAQVTAHFPQVRALFERCANRAVRGEFDADDLLRLAREGRMYIGIAYDGDESESQPVMACAFEFVQYPRLTALNIAALAGQRLDAAMRALWPTFRRFARLAGADCIQASCSPAMARLLQRYGFGEVYHVMRSAL